MTTNCDGIHIQIISGGIVNFGGANTIAPITVTKSASGSGHSKSGANVIDHPGELLDNLMNRF